MECASQVRAIRVDDEGRSEAELQQLIGSIVEARALTHARLHKHTQGPLGSDTPTHLAVTHKTHTHVRI
jgi:hypothetical protein